MECDKFGICIFVKWLLLYSYYFLGVLMTVCIDDRAPSGAPGLPLKADGTKWNYATKYAGLEDCEIVIRVGVKGGSFAEMCAELGMGKVTVKKWMIDFPEFGAAVEYAKALSESWWRKKGQENLEYIKVKGEPEKMFRSEIWKFTLQSEFDAKEKDTSVVLQVDKNDNLEKVRELVERIRREEI